MKTFFIFVVQFIYMDGCFRLFDGTKHHKSFSRRRLEKQAYLHITDENRVNQKYTDSKTKRKTLLITCYV